MRAVLATLATLLAVSAAGCGGEAPSLPPATPAATQEADVGWVEPTAKDGPRLVFLVHELDILRDGWRARVAIRNESGIPWEFGDDRDASALSFGVMLFVTGELDELERRNQARELPGLRRAQEVTPAPPAVLAPGETWQGTIEAQGSLAAGRWLRLVFGPLTARGDAPNDLPATLLWITDNAHRLRA